MMWQIFILGGDEIDEGEAFRGGEGRAWAYLHGKDDNYMAFRKGKEFSIVRSSFIESMAGA